MVIRLRLMYQFYGITYLKTSNCNRKPAARSNFLTKHCNIITADSSTEAYIDIQDLQQCRINDFDWSGRDVYVGLDLSLTNDNTSVVMITRDEYGHLVSHPMCFIPTDNIDKKQKKRNVII